MAQSNIDLENTAFAPCPYCKAQPSIRETTDQERKFSAARRFRLSHECNGVNCLLYGRSVPDLSYEWFRFISSPMEQKL